MSRKQFDFSKRKTVEVPYSQLKHVMDTRIEGSQNLDFVTKELMPTFKNAEDALDEILKHPIETTGDFVLVTGRNMAMCLRIILGEDDPKIPVEVLLDVPSFDALDDEDKLRLRKYALSKDVVKDRRRGLKDDDLYFNIQHYVENGYSKEQVVQELQSFIKPWRIERLFNKAFTTWKQRQIRIGRVEAEELRKAKKPVNYDRICERLGLPASAAKDIQNPLRRGQTTMTVIQLKRKQNNLTKSKEYADTNFLHYTLSATGILATSDFPDKKPMSSRTFLEITEFHLKQARNLVSLWEGAMQRARNEVARRETQSLAAASGRS